MPQTKVCLLLLSIIAVNLAQSCNSGSYFDGSQCKNCPSSCAVCMSPTICTNCQTQAFLTINNGGLSCQWCSSLIPNCAICASETSCTVCIQGYQVSNDVCVADESGGQVTLASSQITCQSYQVNLNGVCHPSIALCQHYNADGTCNACEDGNLLIQGYCIPSSLASNLGADSKNSPPSLVCQQRQYISNGECLTMGPACLNFFSNGTCTECDVGYTLFRGLCIQDLGESKVVVSYIPTLKGDRHNDSENQPNANEFSEKASSSTIAQAQPQSSTPQASSCNSPCATCSQPTYCLTCQDGYTTVDVLPGQCFQI